PGTARSASRRGPDDRPARAADRWRRPREIHLRSPSASYGGQGRRCWSRGIDSKQIARFAAELFVAGAELAQPAEDDVAESAAGPGELVGDVGHPQAGLPPEIGVGRPIVAVGAFDVITPEQVEGAGVALGVAVRSQMVEGIGEQAADPLAMEPPLRVRVVAAGVGGEIRVEAREVDAGDRDGAAAFEASGRLVLVREEAVETDAHERAEARLAGI